MVNSELFEVDSKFDILQPGTHAPSPLLVGQGAYGTVVSAHNLTYEPPQPVAIKKISGCFDHPVMSKRTLR